MGFLKKVIENLLLFTIIVLMLGALVSGVEYKYNSPYAYGIKNSLSPLLGTVENQTPQKMPLTKFIFTRTYEYLKFSVEVFKNQTGTTKIIRGQNEVIEIHISSPSEMFYHVVGVSAGDAILNTLLLLTLTMILVFVIGLSWGLRAGYKGGWWDKTLRATAPLFSAIPGWFWGIFLMWVLWWKLSVVPLSYIDYIHQVEANGHVTPLTYLYAMTIPVLTLTFVNTAVYAYNVRTLVVKELDQDYFMVDLLKGLPDRRVMKKALRTVLPSFLTFTSYNFLNLMINGMAVEVMFNVPGIGATFAGGVAIMIQRLNGELIFFSALVMALFYFINSTIMEGIYLRLDPRVRHDV